MGETADYFKREKYITRRLSLVALAGTILLTPIVRASGHGRISAHALEWTILAYVAFVAFAVVFIVRGAYAKFPKSNVPDNGPLDDLSKRKIRRRIWILEFFAAFYALGLLNALFHAHRGTWLATAIGAAITFIIEIVMIKSIRRLAKKLKPATAMTPPAAAEVAHTSK
jgi:hypothetical protein